MLLREHKAVTNLFRRHQETLLARDWARAARLLACYQKRLATHIRLEDELLLPYANTAGDRKLRWDAHVYMVEHRKLLELTCELDNKLATARRRGITPAMLIDLLDEEMTLKHVFEHHHEREEKGLFEELPMYLPVEAKARLRAVLLTQH